MKITSVRARLTLWNVSVLAFALVGFAGAVQYTVASNLIRSTDDALKRAALEFQQKANHYHSLARNGRGKLPEEDARLTFLKQAMESYKKHYGPPREFTVSALDLPPFIKSPMILMRDIGPSGETETRQFHSLRVLDTEGHPVSPFTKEASWGNGPWDGASFRTAASGHDAVSVIKRNGEPFRIYSMPFTRDGKILGVVQIAHPMAELRGLLQSLNRTLFALVPIALILAGLGGAFLTDRALRPVRRISEAAEELEASDLSHRLPVTGGDEFAELAGTFNRMIGRLEEAFGRLETACEQQRRFTADASHELRTPLTSIKGNTSLALRGVRSPEDYQVALKAADRAADTMTRIIQDLLLLASSDGGQLEIYPQPVLLHSMLEEAAASARHGMEGAEIQVHVPREWTVQGDHHHLIRLFTNLLENALRHTPATGSIMVDATIEGNKVVTTVRDTGEGISPEHLPHVCERFYRVDAARSRSLGGSGLGLAIACGIVEAHAGSLNIASEPGEGTCVTVSLPLAKASGQRYDEELAIAS